MLCRGSVAKVEILVLINEISKEFSLGGKSNHCFIPFIKTMHTSKSSEEYLFASFDNLDLRSFSSHKYDK